MTKTIEEINQKIKEGKAVVFTAEEIIDFVKEKGAKKAAQEVDIVTTGTFGPMCSSGAYLNLGHTKPKIKLGGFNISDANKVERRFYDNVPNRWVYRNLLTFAYPAKIGKFEFTPYLSDEIYYDFEVGKANLNWATLGVNKKINKYLTLGLYYRAETSRIGSSSKWLTNQILGSNVTVDF